MNAATSVIGIRLRNEFRPLLKKRGDELFEEEGIRRQGPAGGMGDAIRHYIIEGLRRDGLLNDTEVNHSERTT